MGEVWVIEHQTVRRRFALKILHSRFKRFADRMRVEAETMGRLSHPNVVEVIDFWVASDGRGCVVMELLQGRTLWDELAERVRLPVSEALSIARQTLSALSAAHAIGVVHRDIKPENLFLHQVPGAGRVLKVLDFGMARILPQRPEDAPQPPEVPTATGAIVGSPRFMSPEGARGERVDARADLFSLGVVLYVMLVGEGPYDYDVHPQAPSRVLGQELPPALDELVLRAIRELPSERFQSADEFLTELTPLIAQSKPASSAP
jgi:serine/threonine-protein kinase